MLISNNAFHLNNMLNSIYKELNINQNFKQQLHNIHSLKQLDNIEPKIISNNNTNPTSSNNLTYNHISTSNFFEIKTNIK